MVEHVAGIAAVVAVVRMAADVVGGVHSRYWLYTCVLCLSLCNATSKAHEPSVQRAVEQCMHAGSMIERLTVTDVIDFFTCSWSLATGSLGTCE